MRTSSSSPSVVTLSKSFSSTHPATCVIIDWRRATRRVASRRLINHRLYTPRSVFEQLFHLTLMSLSTRMLIVRPPRHRTLWLYCLYGRAWRQVDSSIALYGATHRDAWSGRTVLRRLDIVSYRRVAASGARALAMWYSYSFLYRTTSSAYNNIQLMRVQSYKCVSCSVDSLHSPSCGNWPEAHLITEPLSSDHFAPRVECVCSYRSAQHGSYPNWAEKNGRSINTLSDVIGQNALCWPF